MASSTTEKTFKISVTGNAATEGAKVASSSREAAKQIAAYDAKVKSLSGDLRRLRGNSEEVRNAKARLRQEINSAKDASSKLVLQLRNQGTSYDKASKQAEKYKNTLRALKVAGLALKPVSLAARAVGALRRDGVKGTMNSAKESLRSSGAGRIVGAARAARGDTKGFSGFRKALGGATSEAKALASQAQIGEMALSGLSMAGSAAATGVVAVGAAASAAVAAIAAATAAVIAFSLKSSDAAATQRRHAMALGWSEQNARNLGDQVQELAGKTSLGVEELSKMSLELSKTKLSGKAAVDTMNAVAQASSAVDAAAGDKLKEILTRSARSGRMFLGARELEGTGLNFDDVAKEYAAGTKKSIAAARSELSSGRAPLEAGAEAVRAATEKKFGKLNVANAFSLENAPKKFGVALANLASGVDLSPISEQFAKVYEMLKPEAPLGKAIKTIVESLGTGFVDIASNAIPLMVDGFKWLMVGALKLSSKYYELKIAAKEAFSTDGWSGAGKAIVKGLVDGLLSMHGFLLDSFAKLGKMAITAFKNVLGIKSPSKVFESLGKHTTAGYVQGIQQGDSTVTHAVADMVNVPSPARVDGRSATAAKVELHVHINAAGATADELKEESFLQAMVKVCVDTLQASGLELAT